MSDTPIHIVGGGLAGSEAAYFLAKNGISVILYEMRPKKMTPAHQTSFCAELVCSNSFKSQAEGSASELLKKEMRCLGSMILEVAAQTSVPAGEALAVDRNLFAQEVTRLIPSNPKIQLIHEEITRPPQGITILATGPLTSMPLIEYLSRVTHSEDLYFYDAIAPIVDADSLCNSKIYACNRYEKGGEIAYLNCPLTQEEYEHFVDSLLTAEVVQPKPFEKQKYFQGCQPIEAIAQSGRDSLRFGPMKPVGLPGPRTGRLPYAVLQLRPENASKSAFNLVGCQTKLKYGEQNRIFRLTPGLSTAEFLRYGSIHRNTYIHSPQALYPDMSLKKEPSIYLAGQITGVEGYLESAASGLLTASFVLQRLKKQAISPPPAHTMLGALHRYLICPKNHEFQPTNAHFGLLEPCFFDGLPPTKNKGDLRNAIVQQASLHFKQWQTSSKSLERSSPLGYALNP